MESSLGSNSSSQLRLSMCRYHSCVASSLTLEVLRKYSSGFCSGEAHGRKLGSGVSFSLLSSIQKYNNHIHYPYALQHYNFVYQSGHYQHPSS
jgi:hypothetical protein